MQVKIVRIDKSLPLPEYKTEGAAAFDLYTRIAAVLKPHTPTLLPSNLIIEVPQGYFLMLAARSGLSKRGLRMSNGVGVIDQDYHGPEDEIQMLVYNYTNGPISVEKGERLAQGLLIPIEQAKWQEVDKIKDESRGGFGTTGKV